MPGFEDAFGLNGSAQLLTGNGNWLNIFIFKISQLDKPLTTPAPLQTPLPRSNYVESSFFIVLV